jgi:RND family efflux transporter MFP subunit
MMDAEAARPPARLKLFVIGLVACLLIGAAVVLVKRVFDARELGEATREHARQYVATTKPSLGGRGVDLTLPGTLQGINEATVYARTNGYVLRWVKDIGASVKKGDLLAEIATPEVDQELSQAAATEEQSSSSASLAKSTAERWKQLRDKDAVTQQDFDERESAYRQAAASLTALQANVSRLKHLQAFNRVTAPFDGVVTSRNIDVGDLVDAGSGAAAKALFTVSQIDPLRLYIFVPQVYASQVKVGDQVDVTLAGNLEQTFKGTIARTARSIDTATRTMQVEIQVPNAQAELISGSYVEAKLPIKQDRAALLVPTNVLLFRPDGPRIAVVDDQGVVHLHLVKLGTDFGSSVAVLSGLKISDVIVVNPPDSINEGDVVSIAAKNDSDQGTAKSGGH